MLYHISQIVTVSELKRAIVHDVDLGEREPTRYKYGAIRCGLAWPGLNTPPYYIILGEEKLDPISDHDGFRKTIRFLCEHQGADLELESFFDRMTDDCLTVGCREIYADIAGANENFRDGFWQWQEKNNQRRFSLHQAPFASSWTSGIAAVTARTRDKTLRLLEGTIVLDQLRRISRSDLENQPEKFFWAVKALCHAIAAFKKYPTSNYSDDFSRPARDGCSDVGWMAI